MSLYPNSNIFTTQKIANGFATQMQYKPKNKTIFLDVTPARTPNIKSATILPMHDNLMDRQISTDVIYENVKPVLTLLRLMGVFPLSRPSPRINQFNFASSSMVYSIVMFVTLITYVLYLTTNKVQILKNSEGKFEETVIEYLFSVYFFPIIFIPIFWQETRKIAEVLNQWVEFEISYKKVSGKVLALKTYRKALLIAIIIPILSTVSVIVTHVTMVHFKVLQLVPYVFLEILTYMLGGYWYLLCELLGVCANLLADEFQHALRHVGPAGKVAEYRALWLRLSRLARDTGIANSYTFTAVCLYLFLIITLSIYGLLSQISEGFGTKDIGLAVTACCSITLLFYICDEAHYASHNVRTNFQKKLLIVELSWMNTDALTEVNMFLRATEMNPSQISLGGFFDVNRNLFKSLLATMVTYLVVLLQFQISIPDESQNINIVTEDSFINYTEPMTVTSTMTTILTTIAKKKRKH